MKQQDKDNRKLPSPEIKNYGDDREEKGYESGYKQSSLDTRKRKFFKEKEIRKISDRYLDWLDDEIAKHKKKW